MSKKVTSFKGKPVVVEQTYSAPAARVWKALTNKDEMKHWYFALKEFKPKVGFEFEFTVKDNWFHPARASYVSKHRWV